MTIAVAPLTTTVMNSVSGAHAGAASGINNAVSRVAGLIAIATMSLVFAALFDGFVGARLDAIHAATPAKGAALTLSFGHDAAGGVERAAFEDAYRLVMTLAGLLAAAGGVVAGLWVRGKTKEK
jgi:hypothetical protein